MIKNANNVMSGITKLTVIFDENNDKMANFSFCAPKRHPFAVTLAKKVNSEDEILEIHFTHDAMIPASIFSCNVIVHEHLTRRHSASNTITLKCLPKQNKRDFLCYFLISINVQILHGLHPSIFQ